MKYIDSWLSGLGLEYIIPKLKENGITTPKKLAQLSLRDIYDVVGVEDEEHRKKLYFLIQRLQTVNYFICLCKKISLLFKFHLFIYLILQNIYRFLQVKG
jgi:hypothetical protein